MSILEWSKKNLKNIFLVLVVFIAVIIVFLFKNDFFSTKNIADSTNKVSENEANTEVTTVETVEVVQDEDQNISEESTSDTSSDMDKITDPALLSLTADKFDLTYLKSFSIPMMLDFSGESCPACEVFEPIMEEAYEDYLGNVIIQTVDVWADASAADGFPITVIPTQIFYDGNGNAFVPSTELSEEIDFSFYADKNTGEHMFTSHEGVLTTEQLAKIFTEMGVSLGEEGETD